MQPFTHWNSLLAGIAHIGEQFQVGLMNAQVQPDRMWSKRWGGKQNDRQVKLQVDMVYIPVPRYKIAFC